MGCALAAKEALIQLNSARSRCQNLLPDKCGESIFFVNTDRTITGLISLVLLRLLQLAIVAISSTAFAQEIAKPKVVREVLLTHQDDVINPWAVTKTNDGGFVIAGSAGLSAWATKIDGAGNVAWNYVRGLQDNVRGVAEFRGAVAMPDSTTYLCGWMPRPPGSQAPAAMLTRLDAAGRLISEKFMTAQGIPDGGTFADCVRWGDGIAVVGQIGRLVRPAAQGVYPIIERSYRLLTLDAAGNVRWDVQIPIGVRFGAFSVGPLLAIGDSSLAFSATDNLSSEVVRVSATGMVQKQKQISGAFQLIRPGGSDNAMRLWGRFAPKEPAAHSILTLNNELEEVGKVDQPHAVNCFARVVYRLADQSLALFGSTIEGGGSHFTSVIVHAGADLQSDQSLEPPRIRSPFVDKGSIWAAGPRSADREFVAARSLALRSDQNFDLSDGTPKTFRRGVAVDFIQIN
jgi:hypothetical protein